MNKWTSRKLFVALGVFATSTALLAMGMIDQETWKWASGITVGGYLLAQGFTDGSGK